jgi:hypothetical protein
MAAAGSTAMAAAAHRAGPERDLGSNALLGRAWPPKARPVNDGRDP